VTFTLANFRPVADAGGMKVSDACFHAEVDAKVVKVGATGEAVQPVERLSLNSTV
jgi:hypothetical protein